MIKAILFDMDGTLLPMDVDLFLKAYMGGLGEKVASLGLDPKTTLEALWKGTGAMVKNDGSMTNEERFWSTFAKLLGDQILRYQPDFDEFYTSGFDGVKISTTMNPQVPQLIRELKEKGLRLAIATNPLFPEAAQYKRVAWAGLDLSDFELITTYSNSHYCKPNPAYYQEVLDKLALKPEEVIMVGNDAREDVAAAQLGIQVFLVTDCLLNPDNIDINAYPNGDFNGFRTFLDEILGAD